MSVAVLNIILFYCYNTDALMCKLPKVGPAGHSQPMTLNVAHHLPKKISNINQIVNYFHSLNLSGKRSVNEVSFLEPFCICNTTHTHSFYFITELITEFQFWPSEDKTSGCCGWSKRSRFTYVIKHNNHKNFTTAKRDRL